MFIFQLTGDSVQTPPNKYRCPNKNKTKQNRTEQTHKTKHQLDFLTSIWFTEVNECGILRSFAQNRLSYPILWDPPVLYFSFYCCKSVVSIPGRWKRSPTCIKLIVEFLFVHFTPVSVSEMIQIFMRAISSFHTKHKIFYTTEIWPDLSQ